MEHGSLLMCKCVIFYTFFYNNVVYTAHIGGNHELLYVTTCQSVSSDNHCRQITTTKNNLLITRN